MKNKLVVILLLISLLVGCSTTNSRYFKNNLGEYQEEVYLNEKLGFKFENIDGFKLSTKESLQVDLENLYADKTSQEIKELDKSRKLLTAYNEKLDVSMRVDLEYRKDDPRIDVGNYVNYMIDYYAESDSLDLQFLNTYSYKIANQEFTLLTAISRAHARVIYFYLRPYDDYMLVITISTIDTLDGHDAVLELLKSFQEY